MPPEAALFVLMVKIFGGSALITFVVAAPLLAWAYWPRDNP